ncbi:hybrid sensor histidine kinase/response regulator [Trinickia fusca]|nr:ATP-binding protein [Trinickia fusca]
MLLAALWFALGALTVWDENAEMRSARAGANALADALAAHSTRVMREAEQVAALVSWQVQNDGVSIPLAYYVSSGLLKLDVFVQVAVIDSQGYLRASTVAGFQPINLSDREHFQAHVHNPSTALMIGRPLVGRASGKASLQLSQRINGLDGRFLGVVVVSVAPSYFTELYNGLHIGKSGIVSVVGTHDFVVRALRAGLDRSVGTTLPRADPLRRALEQAPSGTLRMPAFIDGRDAIVSYRTLPDYPLAVAVGYLTRDYLSAWLTRSLLLLTAALALTVLIVVVERRTRNLVESLAAANEREMAKAQQLETARRDAEAASRAKSSFLATMSHEIRTPMNGVIGMAEVLARSLLSADQKDMVVTIRDSASALLRIIDDILDFSKIEAGKMQIESAPVSIEDIVDGLCSSLASVADARGVVLRTYVSPDLPAYVMSDDTRLREVLYNLVGNAIKFSGGREGVPGRVSVRATLYEGAEDIAIEARFEIADNGIGMAPETIKKLFQPFSQAEASTTRRFGGTGLGLAICRRLVSLMGGDLTVSSEPGRGSTFVVRLPLTIAPDAPVRAHPDLSGISCIVSLSRGFDGDIAGIVSYLDHAGASVTLVRETRQLHAQLAQTSGVVVLVVDEDSPAVIAAAADPAHAAAGRVMLTAGRGLTVISADDRTVSLGAQAMRRRVLLDAVLLAGGRVHPQPAAAHLAEETGTPMTHMPPAPGTTILVAEDDAVNRTVISRQLALLGYQADMAVDGEEALRRWREKPYTLVLTDLHMPKRDGYELAQAIRAEEVQTHRKRIPIVALTANAIHGEATRAKGLGIDDYLTKPLKLNLLQQALEQWTASPSADAEADTAAADSAEPIVESNEPAEAATPSTVSDSPAPAPADDAGLIDLDVLKGIVGDDPETVQMLLQEYVECSESLARELVAHLNEHRRPEAAAVAHKLKSSSRSIGATSLGELCARIESVAQTQDDASLAALAVQFDTAYRLASGVASRLAQARRLAQTLPAGPPA